MKLIYTTSFFLLSLLFYSCSTDSDYKTDENSHNFNLDTNLKFTLFDDEGKDLLNPENLNGISESQIRIFYKVDGELKEIYNSNLEHPRNFRIYKGVEGEFKMVLFPNHSKEYEKPVTYIKWNEIDTDTIEVSYERFLNAIRTGKVWLNGNLISDRTDDLNSDPIFTLIKNY